MTIETADMKFLSRAMGAPVPFGADPEKWTRAALLNGEKRAAGVATIEALLYQLPTPEDAARTPVETPKRSAYPIDPKVYAVSDGFHSEGEWLGQWGNHNGAAYYEGLCPCNNGKGFGDCHGLAPAE